MYFKIKDFIADKVIQAKATLKICDKCGYDNMICYDYCQNCGHRLLVFKFKD